MQHINWPTPDTITIFLVILILLGYNPYYVAVQSQSLPSFANFQAIQDARKWLCGQMNKTGCRCSAKFGNNNNSSTKSLPLNNNNNNNNNDKMERVVCTNAVTTTTLAGSSTSSSVTEESGNGRRRQGGPKRWKSMKLLEIMQTAKTSKIPHVRITADTGLACDCRNGWLAYTNDYNSLLIPPRFNPDENEDDDDGVDQDEAGNGSGQSSVQNQRCQSPICALRSILSIAHMHGLPNVTVQKGLKCRVLKNDEKGEGRVGLKEADFFHYMENQCERPKIEAFQSATEVTCRLTPSITKNPLGGSGKQQTGGCIKTAIIPFRPMPANNSGSKRVTNLEDLIEVVDSTGNCNQSVRLSLPTNDKNDNSTGGHNNLSVLQSGWLICDQISPEYPPSTQVIKISVPGRPVLIEPVSGFERLKNQIRRFKFMSHPSLRFPRDFRLYYHSIGLHGSEEEWLLDMMAHPPDHRRVIKPKHYPYPLDNGWTSTLSLNIYEPAISCTYGNYRLQACNEYGCVSSNFSVTPERPVYPTCATKNKTFIVTSVRRIKAPSIRASSRRRITESPKPNEKDESNMTSFWLPVLLSSTVAVLLFLLVIFRVGRRRYKRSAAAAARLQNVPSNVVVNTRTTLIKKKRKRGSAENNPQSSKSKLRFNNDNGNNEGNNSPAQTTASHENAAMEDSLTQSLIPNPSYITWIEGIRSNNSIPIIAFDQLSVVRLVGEGAFGEVFLVEPVDASNPPSDYIQLVESPMVTGDDDDPKSMYEAKNTKNAAFNDNDSDSADHPPQQLAMKTLKLESSEQMRDMEREAATLVNLNHRNIVRFHGMTFMHNNLGLLFEFMHKGDLVNYLRSSTRRERAVAGADAGAGRGKKQHKQQSAHSSSLCNLEEFKTEPDFGDDSTDFDAAYSDDTEQDIGNVQKHGSVIMHLLSQVKIGMDLSKITLPTFILERRSLLEIIPDMKTPEERMICVVKWYLSSFHCGRRKQVAKKPYNPILGEIFKCKFNWPDIKLTNKKASDGPVSDADDSEVTFIAEQVSHHPPISAFYAENREKGIQVDAQIYTKSKLHGLSIGVHNIGHGYLTLLHHNEQYVVQFPSAYGRSILTTPWFELIGSNKIVCNTGYHAEVDFHGKPFIGGRPHHVTAEIFRPQERSPFLNIKGAWNGTMTIQKGKSKEETLFLDVTSMPIIRKITLPVMRQDEFESRRLWRHVTVALRDNDITLATKGKRWLEDRQRADAKYRSDKGIKWQTKYFTEVKEGAWFYESPLTDRYLKGEKALSGSDRLSANVRL